MSQISIMVKGNPVAQPRPRATIRGGKIRVYNKSTSNEWKGSVMAAFKDYINLNIDAPVNIEIMYYMKRPKSMLRKKDIFDIIPHIKKPDLDNLNKAVLDALTSARVWVDDSRVFNISASKFYTHKDNECIGASITLYY